MTSPAAVTDACKIPCAYIIDPCNHISTQRLLSQKSFAYAQFTLRFFAFSLLCPRVLHYRLLCLEESVLPLCHVLISWLLFLPSVTPTQWRRKSVDYECSLAHFLLMSLELN